MTAHPPPSPPSPPPLAGIRAQSALVHRVLHVEDNPNDARMLIEAVTESRLDLAIDLVANGVRAIERLHEAADPAGRLMPELILLDLNMPVMDGMTLLRLFSRHELWRRVPVVVLSGLHCREEQDRAHQLGALAYVVKPRVYSGYLELAWRLPYFPREAAGLLATATTESSPMRS